MISKGHGQSKSWIICWFYQSPFPIQMVRNYHHFTHAHLLFERDIWTTTLLLMDCYGDKIKGLAGGNVYLVFLRNYKVFQNSQDGAYWFLFWPAEEFFFAKRTEAWNIWSALSLVSNKQLLTITLSWSLPLIGYVASWIWLVLSSPTLKKVVKGRKCSSAYHPEFLEILTGREPRIKFILPVKQRFAWLHSVFVFSSFNLRNGYVGHGEILVFMRLCVI
jgi:hypothetical protein